MKNQVVLYRPESDIVSDAFDKVVVEVHMAKNDRGYQTFMLTGTNPLVGTTTNAINLAISMALAGWKTVLLDADMRKGSKFKRLNSVVQAGLAEYLNHGADLEEVLYRTNYENLSYISCGNDIDSSVRLLCSNKMQTLIETLKQEFDYVIFDIPSVNVTPDATILLPVVDAVILVTAINESTRHELGRAVDKLSRYEGKLLGLIVNKTEMDDYKSQVSKYDYFNSDNLQNQYLKNIKKKKKK